MIDRRTRQVGVQLIETALAKLADAQFILPPLAVPRLPPKPEPTESATAKAVMPKVLNVPV